MCASDGPAVSVNRLTKRFGDRVAFQDVSFEVGYGEVFGFLGPNGAGKTTTVRTLGTLIAPTSGSATIAGVPLRTGERGRDPPPDRDHARGAGPVPAPDGGREPRVLRRALRRAGARRSGSIVALQAVNLADRADDLVRLAVQRAAPAGRARAGAARRSRGAVPRRADVRAGPGRRARRARADRRAPRRGA